MSDKIAFALREEFEGTVTIGDGDDAEERPKFLGGVIRAGARDLNLRELVDERDDGVIVVGATDQAAVTALDESPALKRVSVPKDADVTAGQYDQATVPALRAEAARRGLEGLGSANKADVIAALERHDAGENPTEEA